MAQLLFIVVNINHENVYRIDSKDKCKVDETGLQKIFFVICQKRTPLDAVILCGLPFALWNSVAVCSKRLS